MKIISTYTVLYVNEISIKMEGKKEMRNYRSIFSKELARDHLAVDRAIALVSSDSFAGTLSAPWDCLLTPNA